MTNSGIKLRILVVLIAIFMAAPTLAFADILGNPLGGEVGKVRYAHDIGVDLLLDFQRMLGWKGSRFEVSMSSRSGDNLSTDIGNVLTVAATCRRLVSHRGRHL